LVWYGMLYLQSSQYRCKFWSFISASMRMSEMHGTCDHQLIITRTLYSCNYIYNLYIYLHLYWSIKVCNHEHKYILHTNLCALDGKKLSLRKRQFLEERSHVENCSFTGHDMYWIKRIVLPA
jgi:hypothetical protein